MHLRQQPIFRSIPLILALLILTASAASVKTHPRHDGKSHNAAHEAAEAGLHPRNLPVANSLDPRQQPSLSLMEDPPLASQVAVPAGNGPVGGISNMIAPPLPPISPSAGTALGPPISPTGPSIPASPTMTPSGSPGALSAVPISVSDGFPNPFPSATSYHFPSTTIQIPIATVCPDTPANSAIFNILPYSSLVSSNMSTTNYLPPRPSTTSVTAFLPNGSSTVFLTTTRLPASGSPVMLRSSSNDTDASPTIDGLQASVLPSGALPLNAQDRTSGDPTARILLDSDGCQTLCSPVTTALCRTTVRLIGIPDATITDCDQYVTFSSDAATASADAITGPVASPTTSNGPPGTYYEAHWYDLVHGGVPRDVRVESCIAVSGPYSGDWVTCQTESQRWSVSTATKTTAAISVASYSGPAILTAATLTVTTTLSFQTTLTLPKTILTPTVIKETLGVVGTSMEQGTVTVQATVPHTIQLAELTRTSEVWVTETSYVQGTEIVTRTMGS